MEAKMEKHFTNLMNNAIYQSCNDVMENLENRNNVELVSKKKTF